MRLRLMVQGIDTSKLSDMVIAGLSRAQLDFQLLDYYKLLATLYIQTKDADKANEALKKYHAIMTMQDTDGTGIDKEARMLELAKNLDKLSVTITKESLERARQEEFKLPEYNPKVNRN